MTKEIKNKQESTNTQDFSSFFYLSEIPTPEGKVSDVEVLRVGNIYHGGIKVTSKMLDDYVRNFQDNVYGTDLQVNLTHNRGDEAAGWIQDLYRNGDKLMAKVEWTELGEEKITKKLFRYVSSELAPTIQHHLTGKSIANVFIGLGLTNTPAMKGQIALALSESLELQFNKNKMNKENIVLDENKVEETKVEPTEEVKEEVNSEAGEAGDTTETKEVESKEESTKEVSEEKEEESTEETKELSENIDTVSLAEFTKLQEEHIALKEKLETKELNEVINNNLMLSDKNTIGFVKEQKEGLISFMKALTEEQRDQFVELVGSVRTVELGEKGSAKKMEAKNKSYEDMIVEKAEELMGKNKNLSVEEAQKMAAKELKK